MAGDAPAFRGSFPPLVTPFAEDVVDLETYAALVQLHIDRGSQGVVVCGTTGEPSMLTISERKSLAETAIGAAAGRFPVIVATGSQSLAETLELTEHADGAGADALLIVTPYYSRPSARGLVQYFDAVASSTDRPVLLYHIPGRTSVTIDLPVLEAIVQAAANVIGMKHAATDLALVSDALAAFGPEFCILVGLEELSLPMLALGACGMVNAVGNVAPERVVALWRAVESGDLASARTAHQDLLELNRSVFLDTNPVPVKYMMRRLGMLPSNTHRLPLCPASESLETRLDGVLQRAGLLP